MKTSQTHRNYKLNTGTSNKTCQCPPAAQIVRPVISEIRKIRARGLNPLTVKNIPTLTSLGGVLSWGPSATIGSLPSITGILSGPQRTLLGESTPILNGRRLKALARVLESPAPVATQEGKASVGDASIEIY